MRPFRFAKLFVLCAIAGCTLTPASFTKRERRRDPPEITTNETDPSWDPAEHPAEQHNVDVINEYRARSNLLPLVMDATLNDFALAGTRQLIADHTPHAHFEGASSSGALWTSGFASSAAENQGDPNGWYRMHPQAAQNMILQIEDIQLEMFNEGPGAGHEHGHYMNMMNPRFRRVGVGLAMVDGELYLTNDFSE